VRVWIPGPGLLLPTDPPKEVSSIGATARSSREAPAPAGGVARGEPMVEATMVTDDPSTSQVYTIVEPVSKKLFWLMHNF
jgi:hypothetical protein